MPMSAEITPTCCSLVKMFFSVGMKVEFKRYISIRGLGTAIQQNFKSRLGLVLPDNRICVVLLVLVVVRIIMKSGFKHTYFHTGAYRHVIEDH
jgi:hypothetical protein